MKKTFLLFLAVSITAIANAQFSYKLGIVTPFPTDTDVPQTSIGIGSTLGEANYKLSKKISAVGTLGYIRYKDAEGAKFSQIPVTVGGKYAIDSMFHFGATAGVAFHNKKGSDFIYTPYIGLTVKKVTFDIHYFNTVRTVEPIKILALVFSYSL